MFPKLIRNYKEPDKLNFDTIKTPKEMREELSQMQLEQKKHTNHIHRKEWRNNRQPANRREFVNAKKGFPKSNQDPSGDRERILTPSAAELSQNRKDKRKEKTEQNKLKSQLGTFEYDRYKKQGFRLEHYDIFNKSTKTERDNLDTKFPQITSQKKEDPFPDINSNRIGNFPRQIRGGSSFAEYQQTVKHLDDFKTHERNKGYGDKLRDFTGSNKEIALKVLSNIGAAGDIATRLYKHNEFNTEIGAVQKLVPETKIGHISKEQNLKELGTEKVLNIAEGFINRVPVVKQSYGIIKTGIVGIQTVSDLYKKGQADNVINQNIDRSLVKGPGLVIAENSTQLQSNVNTKISGRQKLQSAAVQKTKADRDFRQFNVNEMKKNS
ncbi:MAG: hypothetical protein HRT35_12665 [Algicola sp.]|nr:hypothetical protein [Algicola sp.]